VTWNNALGHLSIEPIGELKRSVCNCCGREQLSGHGFVYEDEEPRAIYFATLHHTTNETNGVSLAVGIGEWNDDGSRQSCTAFGIDVFTAESEIRMKVLNASESPWANTQVLGPLLDREQALAHPLKDKMFEIADCIVRDDAKIAGQLGI
jgi:hypothetical protein